MDIAFLRIRTFVGTVVAGMHYCGTLICREKEIDLECTLTASQAARLNKDSWGVSTYKRGQKSRGFDSKERLIATAVEEYRRHFPKALILIKGDPATAGPLPILCGPPSIMVKLNRLYVEFEKLGRWEGKDRQKVLEICDEFENALREASKPKTKGRKSGSKTKS